jgi:nucleoid-associated protein YgaU
VAESNQPISEQLLREAKIGLTIIALLVGLFCYVAWNRFSGNWDRIPDHVAQAPVAQNMNEAFREERRLQMAKLNRNSRDFEQNSLASRSPRSDEGNNLAPGTFVRGQRQPKPDLLTTSPPQRDVLSPITNNDLRNPSPDRSSSDEVRAASYQENVKTPERFDDPFDSEATSIIPKSTDSIVVPKQDSFRPTQLRPSVPQQPANDSGPTNQAKIKNLPEVGLNDFQPRTELPKPTRSSVTMQSTRFQVQVDPEPLNDPESVAPTRQPIETNFQPAAEMRSPEVATVQSPAVLRNSLEFNELRTENALSREPVREAIEPHKPLTKANDFSTHSMHPLRPVLDSPKPLVAVEPKSKPVGVQKSKGQYTVETSGETLFTIAQEVYGDGRLFRAIYELNRNAIPDPDKLEEGVRLQTPPMSELIQNLSDFVPQDLLPATDSEFEYVTSEGDTLFDIARQKLGQASRFDELIDVNRSRLSLDINHLSPLPAGMRIRLPVQQ